MKTLFRRTLLALALLLPAGALQAQQKAAPAVTEAQAEAWMEELQKIGEKLQPLHAKAMQDPALQARQEAIGTEIKNAITKADAGLVSEMEALQQAAQAAQAAGDEAKLRELAPRAQQLQMRYLQAQQTAMRNEQLVAKLEAFQDEVEKKIIVLDPTAKPLIARYQELGEKLEAAMKAAQ